MWTDLKKGVGWVFGTGPRRISMDPAFEAERIRRSRLTRVLAVLGAIALVVAFKTAPEAWRRVQDWRADRVANESLRAWESGDLTEAGRLAREAGLLSPRNSAVLLARARLASAEEGEDAVTAWEKLLEQVTDQPEYQVELALALQRVGRIGEAQRMLDRSGPARATARGQWIGGLIAAERGDPAQAERQLRSALQLGLKDSAAARLALASVLLGGPRYAEARGLLEALQAHPKLGRRARGLLAEQAQAAGEPARALQLARELVTAPAGKIEDQLRLTRLLVGAQNWVGLEEHLDALLPFARTDRKLAAAQLECLLNLGRFVQAEGWVADLPPEIRNSAEMAPFSARAAAREVRQEGLLRELLRRGDWSGSEVAQLAISARLAEFEQRERLRSERWQKAIAQAGADAPKLRFLAELAQDWRWTKDRLLLLSVLASHPDGRRSELQAWREAAWQARDTSGLASATRMLLAAGETDPDLRLEFARTNLLLRLDLARARTLAAEVSAERPDHAPALAVQAAALRLGGKSADALILLDQVASRGLRAPELELERALTLAQLGRKEEAAATARPLAALPWFPEEAAQLKPILGP